MEGGDRQSGRMSGAAGGWWESMQTPAVGMGPACGVGLEMHTQATEGRNVDRIASSRFWVRSISRVELNT